MTRQTRKEQRGVSMVLALVLVIVVGSLAASYFTLTLNVSNKATASLNAKTQFYQAGQATEELRAAMRTHFKAYTRPATSPFSTKEAAWIEHEIKESGGVFNTTNWIPTNPNATVLSITGSYTGAQAWVDVTMQSAPRSQGGSGVLVAEVVRERLTFGTITGAGTAKALLKFAILCDTINCQCCKMVVDGDVGTLKFLRPGYGNEGGGGKGSGGGSYVYGNVYAALDVSADKSDTAERDSLAELDTSNSKYWQQINALRVGLNGRHRYADNADGTRYKKSNEQMEDPSDENNQTTLIYDNYKGDALPSDTTGDGVADFPSINPQAAMPLANGKISGGIIKVVAKGQKLADATVVAELVSTPETPGGAAQSWDGHVILEGTKDNPLIIDGDIFVGGDILIKGYVKGRAAIYGGRNTYITGDIFYDEPPLPYNKTSGADPVAKARQSIEQEKDELRIASRSNIIIGDYTNLSGSPASALDPATGQEVGATGLPIYRRQSEDFYRAQFAGLINQEIYQNGFVGFSEDGDELLYNTNDGQWYNDLGVSFEQTEIHEFSDKEAIYDAIYKPSQINGSDDTMQWISDGEYRALMGQHGDDIEVGNQKKGLRDNTWRGKIRGKAPEIYQKLLDNGFSEDQALNIMYADPVNQTGNGKKGWVNESSTYVSGYIKESKTLQNKNQAITIRQALDDFFFDNNPNGQAVFNEWAIELGADDANGGGVPDGNKYDYLSKNNTAVPYIKQIQNVDAYLYANRRIAGKSSGTNMEVYGGLVARELGVLVPGQKKEFWLKDNRFNWLNSKGTNPINGEKYKNFVVNYDYRLNEENGKGLDLLGEPVYGEIVFWGRSTEIVIED